MDRLYIIREVVRALWQVRQIFVRQIDEMLPHIFFGQSDKVTSDSIPHAARPAVKHEPDGVISIKTNLDEVIPSSERTEVVQIVASPQFGMSLQDRVVA